MRGAFLAARQEDAGIDQRLDQALGLLVRRRLGEGHGADGQGRAAILLPRRHGKLAQKARERLLLGLAQGAKRCLGALVDGAVEPADLFDKR